MPRFGAAFAVALEFRLSLLLLRAEAIMNIAAPARTPRTTDGQTGRAEGLHGRGCYSIESAAWAEMAVVTCATVVCEPHSALADLATGRRASGTTGAAAGGHERSRRKRADPTEAITSHATSNLSQRMTRRIQNSEKGTIVSLKNPDSWLQIELQDTNFASHFDLRGSIVTLRIHSESPVGPDWARDTKYHQKITF